MDSVWMHHPDLPKDQYYHAAITAVPMMRAAGWRTFSDDNLPEPDPQVLDEVTLTPEDHAFVPAELLPQPIDVEAPDSVTAKDEAATTPEHENPDTATE